MEKKARKIIGPGGGPLPRNFATLEWVAEQVGGLRSFLALVHEAALLGSEECTEFMIGWEAVPEASQSDPMCLDLVSRRLRMSNHKIAGKVLQACRVISMDASRLMAAVEQPNVVRVLSKCAKNPQPEFNRDRRLFLESTGFTPRGNPVAPRTQVQVNNQINNQQVQEADGLLSFESSIASTSRMIRGEE